jgi:hypothetical protein
MSTIAFSNVSGVEKIITLISSRQMHGCKEMQKKIDVRHSVFITKVIIRIFGKSETVRQKER